MRQVRCSNSSDRRGSSDVPLSVVDLARLCERRRRVLLLSHQPRGGVEIYSRLRLWRRRDALELRLGVAKGCLTNSIPPWLSISQPPSLTLTLSVDVDDELELYRSLAFTAIVRTSLPIFERSRSISRQTHLPIPRLLFDLIIATYLKNALFQEDRRRCRCYPSRR